MIGRSIRNVFRIKMTGDADSDRGKMYASFIETQLQSEDARRSSITARAGSALTGVSGLVTLVLAVFAVFLGKDFHLTELATLLLSVAVVALLLAAFCAVRAGSARIYGRADPAGLKRYLGNSWSQIDKSRWSTDSEERARWEVAWVNVEALEKVATGTDKQVGWLNGAAYLQAAAVIALVGTTVSVVMNSDVEEARNAIDDQPGVTRLLDALDNQGLLRSGGDVVKLTTYYRLSCESLKNGNLQSVSAAQKELADLWQVKATVDQIKALEPARANFCAAQ